MGVKTLEVDKDLIHAQAASSMARATLQSSGDRPSSSIGAPPRRGQATSNNPQLTSQSKELVESMTSALEQILPALTGKGMGSQELLQLGLGLGMGVAAQMGKGAVSPNKAGSGMKAEGLGTEPLDGPSRLPDISNLYAGRGLDRDLAKEIEEEEAAEAAKQNMEVLPTPTPDEMPLDAEFVTHPPAGLGTSFIEKPKPGEPSTQHLVPETDGHLRKCKAVIPEGFVEAINYTHTAGQSVDYLPYFPNLNDAKAVGCVRPRRALEDWLVIGFDPWSAGRAPLNTHLIEDLEKEIKADGEAADKKPKLADLSGLDAIQHETSQANKDAEDLEMMETFIRHGKYSEVESMLDNPEWTLPVDAKDIHGNTMFSVACQNSNKRIAKLLLRRGADMNSTNLMGQTPLHYLFAYGAQEMAEYLLSKGADDSLANADGLTCYEGLTAEAVDTL